MAITSNRSAASRIGAGSAPRSSPSPMAVVITPGSMAAWIDCRAPGQAMRTAPAPNSRADRAVRAAAPVSPADPPTTSTEPALHLWASRARSGTGASASSHTRNTDRSPRRPMSMISISPHRSGSPPQEMPRLEGVERHGARPRRTPRPRPSRRRPADPLGTSTATTGVSVRVQGATGSGSDPRNPAPNSPSIKRSHGLGLPRAGFTGTPAATAAAPAFLAERVLAPGVPEATDSTATPRCRRVAGSHEGVASVVPGTGQQR